MTTKSGELEKIRGLIDDVTRELVRGYNRQIYRQYDSGNILFDCKLLLFGI
jgi:hypothetical protein